VCTHGPEAQTLQLFGASDQLGKEQALPSAEHLLFRGWTKKHAQSMLNTLKMFRDKTDSPEVYGAWQCYTTRLDSYETALALATDSSPEMFMV